MFNFFKSIMVLIKVAIRRKKIEWKCLRQLKYMRALFWKFSENSYCYFLKINNGHLISAINFHKLQMIFLQ